MRYLLLAVLFTNCASWAPTREAGIRRVESSRLRNCVTGQCQFEKQCLQESVARCRAQGMESSCGSDSLFTEAPIRCSVFPNSHGDSTRP